MWLLFCATYAALGQAQVDAEGVIDQSSPYKGTAEGSSAAKKPHIINAETRRFSRRVSTFLGVFKILTKLELIF